MKIKTLISALFDEEKGDVRCGNCGKKLIYLTKKAKKSQKSIDKTNFFAIIRVKCSRCCVENELRL